MPPAPFTPSSWPLVWALVQNAGLLVCLAFIHSLLAPVPGRGSVWARNLGTGFLAGVLGIAVIAAAVPYRDGMIFDTRSVILAAAGLFWGPWPTAVAMLMTAAFRIWVGGPVAPYGVAVIFAAGIAGIAWRHFRKNDLATISWRELLLFGFAVHLVMLAIFALGMSGETLSRVALPVLGIYPLATMIIGSIMAQRTRRVAESRLLAESEERFNLVFKGANDGWWDWNLKTGFITFSPRWWEMVGLVPGEKEATPGLWKEVIHPDDRERVERTFREVLESTADHYEIELGLLHRAGHPVTVISRGHVQRDAKGRAMRVSGTNVDITDMRHALDAANASRSLLEAAGRIGRIGYWEAALEVPALFWSDIAAEIHDLPAGTQVSLDHSMTFFPEESRERLLRDADNLQIAGKPFTGEYELITATGRRIHVLVRGEPVTADDGRVVGARGVIQDIDTVKRAAEALQRSESNYREIFNASSDAIFIHDEKTGRVLDVNEPMLAMYGYASKEDVLRMSVQDLSSGAPGYSAAEARENFARTAERGTHVFQWQARRADGSVFWVEVSLRRSQIGGQGRVLASVRDISRRRALEERVHASEKLESLGRLAGGISHDFNNMLGVIMGHADLALQHLREGGSPAEEIPPIREAAERSAELVRQLQVFARMHAGVPRDLDANVAVQDLLALFRRLIGDDVSLKWEPAPESWSVHIDPAHFEQIVTNLVRNARDAVDAGGRLTLRTVNRTGEANESDRVIIEVEDDGRGMDEMTRKRVFEPFFTTKPGGQGTGLGLATVHGLVQQAGGRVEVESRLGDGTSFRVILPRSEAPPVGRKEEVEVPPAVGGRETLLIVEDEPAILYLATRTMELQGYRVLAAASPEAALSFFDDASLKVDLVISDVVLPVMDGCELRRRILALRPGLRFLFISGYPEGIADEGSADAPAGFLAKPFVTGELVRRVRQLLDLAPTRVSD